MALSRFAVAGAVNTGVTYVVYLLLLAFMPYMWAYTMTYVIGLGLGYILNAYWVFKVRPAAKSAMMYPLAYVLNYILGLILLRILVEYVAVPREIAPFAVVAASLPLVYLLTRLVFHGRANEKVIDK